MRVPAGVAGVGGERVGGAAPVLRPARGAGGGADDAVAAAVRAVLQPAAGLRAAEARGAVAAVGAPGGAAAGGRESRGAGGRVQLRHAGVRDARGAGRGAQRGHRVRACDPRGRRRGA